MLWVGLTGGIACGKSTVANILRELSIPIVDADQMAHQALRFHQNKIVADFGSEILDSNGQIDRHLLGEKVFNNEKSKKALEGILHPVIQKKVSEKKRLFGVGGHSIAVYDVPLLFENNMADQFDHTIVVYAPETLSVKRMVENRGLKEEEAKQRLSNQMSIDDKVAKADTVIENEGDLDELRAKVIKWKNTILE